MKYKVRATILVLFLFVITTMGWRMMQEEGGGNHGNQPIAVSADTVQWTEKPDIIQLSGNVEGLTSSIISSRFSGQVTNVLVEDGQLVHKEQALFMLDTVELQNAVRIAQNSVAQAAARFANEKNEYERYVKLFEQGACSRQQMESARTKLLESQADYDSVQANLISAQKQVSEATVRSPVDGVVANRNLTNGQNVSAGSQLMTVEQLDVVHVAVNVGQSDMAYLKIGDTVGITVDAYSDRIFSGQVAVISPVAGKENHMFRIKIKAENPLHMLKPGMFVQVQVKLGVPQKVLSVPRKAVLEQKGIQYVFIAEDGKAKKIRVQTGDILDDRMEIADGAFAGMKILTDNLDKLQDGTSVQFGDE